MRSTVVPKGSSGLKFVLTGSRLVGSWQLAVPQAGWSRDSAPQRDGAETPLAELAVLSIELRRM